MMLDYLRQLFSIFFAITVLYMLLDCEIKFKKNRYLLGLYAAIVIFFDGFVLLNYGYTFFMKAFPLLVHLPVFLAFVFISKFKPIKVFFVQLTVIAICTSFTSMGLILSYFFDSSRVAVNITVYILYLPTLFLIYKYIRPTFLYMMRNTDKGWLGFCIIPLSYVILLYSTGQYNLDAIIIGRIIKNTVLFFIMAFSSYYMILRFFRQTREHLSLQDEQNLLKTQVSAAQVHLESLKESQEKTIIYRHDMRHHLNLIDAYLADNNKAEARKYIKEVGNTIEDAVVEKYCNNYSVNLILHSYISKAKDEGIAVETQIDVPYKNAVSDMDLCVIFSNAIENATNACKNIMNVKDRFIKIDCKNKNDKIYIRITNSYEGNIQFVDGMPESTKEDHGLGTKSIAAVAQKYGGLCSFTAVDGVFTTSIIL